MLSKLRIAALTVKLASLLLMGSEAVRPAYAEGAAEPRVLNVDQMNRRQFRELLKTLPDATLIELKGERITAAELRANVRVSNDAAHSRMQQMMPTDQSIARQAEVKLQVRRAEFLRQAQAKLEAENARAQAELARLRPVAAIEQEAAELWQRAKSASAEERRRIDERAAQILNNLERIQ
jgi:hypothetical protein